jgi:predicted ATPase/DNA-binding CsgD family transcriptional regulator
VGHAAEVAGGLRALRDTRLLTVTGPGGVGKSRVAARIARRARRDYPGGVWYAELSAVSTGEAVAARVADALGALGGLGGLGGLYAPGAATSEEAGASGVSGAVMREEAGASGVLGAVTAEAVGAALRDLRALLVLDTCEHLPAAVSRLAEAVLRRAPGVTVVVTGRQPLDLPGQRVLPVWPLPEADAVRLFADRAAAVDPDFRLAGDTRAAVTAICRRLDGLPLAIELAAAGLRALSAAELLERLPALAARTTSALPRHRDLRSLVAWSHALCGAEQRRLWGALSALGGAFEPGPAEAAGVAAGLLRDRVAGLLGDLVDRSIVLREPGAGYRMLRAYREFGADLLDGGTRRRLAARYGGRADPPPGPPAGPGPGSGPGRAARRERGESPLTARELQVARLITEGLSNPQIADRLVISRRTVDAHVRNILAKGHLASRTHVAAWVTSSGPR